MNFRSQKPFPQVCCAKNLYVDQELIHAIWSGLTRDYAASLIAFRLHSCSLISQVNVGD